MDITGISSNSNLQSALGTSGSVSGDQFLSLLITQLRSQSPLDPMDNTQFLAQLAQFSSLDQIQSLNSRMDLLSSMEQESVTLQQLGQASNLIGHTIDYSDLTTGETRTGVVSSVSLDQGFVALEVNGENVPLGLLLSVHGEQPAQ